jgi:N6-L-threonylcarbamoyladenine synthase
VPFIPVNHLEGHVLSARLSKPDLAFPYLCLLMSGGHTQIIYVKGVGQYEIWGNAIDDAIGECFDKTAKMLKLPYPGGPEIEKRAVGGNKKAYAFPRPLRHEANCNFSFSGLKTAVKYTIDKIPDVTDEIIADICASFQEAVADVLISRLQNSFDLARDKGIKITYLTSGGGVAANSYLKTKMLQALEARNILFYTPPKELCTDNAAMIAWVGQEHIRIGCSGNLHAKPRPRWPLNEVGN